MTEPNPLADDDVFDLDAVEVEAESADPFRFRWRGEVYEMPLAAALDFTDQLALETASETESMRLILGDDQFDRLTTDPMSTGRMNVLLTQWLRHQGLKPGELPASSRFSANTVRRSKRTSRSGR